MEYSDAVAAFFAPRPEGTPVPEAVAAASPARRLRDAGEPLAMHAVWSPLTNRRLAEVGLDFLGAYVGGRATSLGSPAPAVVAAAFAWFEPGMLATVYESAYATVERARLMTVRAEATTASVRSVLEGDEGHEVGGPAEVADLLADAAEEADGAGRPFFSGLRAQGRPDDPYQRLWWACDLVREHRGDSHVAAADAAGVDPVETNILTELWLGMPLYSYAGTRGWAPEVMEAAVARLEERGWVAGDGLTAAGRAARLAIEATTDAQEQSIVDALGVRLDGVCVQLQRWGERCIAAGAFPADSLKRAAG